MQDAEILIVLLWVGDFTGIITECVHVLYLLQKIVWIHFPGYVLERKGFATKNDAY